MKNSTLIPVLAAVMIFVNGMPGASANLGMPSFELLPVEYLEEIGNTEFAYVWSLYVVVLDDSDPPAPVTAEISYIPERGELTADLSFDNQSFHHEFESPDPFLEFADFIGERPDIFFDGPEFDVATDMLGWRTHMMREDIDEFFKFQVRPYDAEPMQYFSVLKWLDEDSADGIDKAIEMIKSLFVEEILEHIPTE
jgi:hypothetical protein